jgi:hypothetical protein
VSSPLARILARPVFSRPSAQVGLGAVSPTVADSAIIPILVGVTGLAIGFGLAYVVTRPKSTAELAHEVLRDEEVRNHVRRAKRARRSR